ncbi:MULTISPECIES: hypothetical protein [Xanthomonas]|uniref:hypothetical protein n=1 Tax=Xanthomonas TaxID=338 RepID=UPI0015630AF9|nr:hypothetical protein [Xanthomonas campestris]MBF9174250.1 hypothetical protein [Xanthomonas campestris pv. campestris]MCC5092546.1 hypothetical protein [Xanthomonas campestris pv. incanae]MDO0841557.1 hypothetical protein [Xanthomonas campestris pv. campestris]MDO0845200.1 hypothetical protein [Xanthomonas campestris pv. campestris]MDO0862049.1 hypothetical protein [Xanthomonas campestris pv. campestris]
MPSNGVAVAGLKRGGVSGYVWNWIAAQRLRITAALFQTMPGKNLVDAPTHEARIFDRQRTCLDDLSHPGIGLPEMAAIRARLQQRRHRGIEMIQMCAQRGSIHPT